MGGTSAFGEAVLPRRPRRDSRHDWVLAEGHPGAIESEVYIPSHFSEPNVQRVHALIEAHSFGMLIVPRADGEMEIAHIPFLLDADPASCGPYGTLRAHVARANPVGARISASARVIAIFTGPHAYVTPRWYEAPATNVPTWNFTAVHAHGVARRIDSRDEVRRALGDLAAKHEGNIAEPWTIEGADAGCIESLLTGIVAFSICIDRLEAKFKLSQNRPQADRARVVRGLRERGGPDDGAVASILEENERRQL